MLEIRQTQDGSQSLYSNKFDALYHSKFGAMDESVHVFISAGLEYFIQKKYETIKIFEMGFGTGLNALLSYMVAEDRNINIHYTTIELFPITIDLAKQLNYIDLLKNEQLGPIFLKLHEIGWNKTHSISSHFSMNKIQGDFRSYHSEENYHVIYYDAFAPSIQDYLWDSSHMKKCYELLYDGGILVTYCAKGQFKRNLRDAGFKVEALPGPYGKREMTRAYKNLVT